MGKSCNVGTSNPMFGKKHTLATRIKMGQSRTGHRNIRWRGGVRLNQGYVHVLMPNHPQADSTGHVFQHRLVMEEHLGRRLLPSEKVHHRNQIKTDNRIANLQLFPNNSMHMKAHHKRDARGRFVRTTELPSDPSNNGDG